MVVYVQVNRPMGKSPETQIQQNAPKDWDDSEERELEWLARGASALARKSMRSIDPNKAEECRKKLLEEIRTPN